MSLAKPTTLWSEVDFNRDGKQVDWIYLHHSVTRSAYGEIMIPITVVKNGSGPTVLLMAGNHGDEYEGQIALVKLIRWLEPDHIKGRVIILPAANLPAAMAGHGAIWRRFWVVTIGQKKGHRYAPAALI